ncbi:hypothetical protein QFC20_006226 [Naganishia adeliensis]|uniref:Uncharacterized protein n=1 Tax=Naganishia adeliensis TaxID=92952 RepID=A0ACC2VDL6_9TREE|nr:hypothetical protein QFC20_006226 [Naganishia adeliensis]
MQRLCATFEDNQPKFLPGGSFVMFKLTPGGTGTDAEGECIDHDDVIRRLKACAKAQTAFRNAAAKGDVERWQIWESTREAELLRLQGEARSAQGA